MTGTLATARATDGRRRRPLRTWRSATTLAAVATVILLQVNHHHTASAQHATAEDGSRAPTSDDPITAAPAHYQEEAGVFNPADGDVDVDDRTLLDCFGEAAKEVLTRHVIPPTDSECRWSWQHLRCEPYCSCHLHHLWGDYHVGRSCRLRRISSGKSDDGGDEDDHDRDREWEEDRDEFCHLPPDTRYARTVRSILEGTEEVADTAKASYLWVRGLAGVARDDAGRRFGEVRDDAGRRLREARERTCGLVRGGGAGADLDDSSPGGKNVVRRKLRELFRCEESSSDAKSGDEEEFEMASASADDDEGEVSPPTDAGETASVVARDEGVSAGQRVTSPVSRVDEAPTVEEENLTNVEIPEEATSNEREAETGASAERDEVRPVDDVAAEGIPVPVRREVIEPIDEVVEPEEGVVQANTDEERRILMEHEEEGLHHGEADYTTPEVKVPSETDDPGQNELMDPSLDVDTDATFEPKMDRKSSSSSGGKAFVG